MVVVFTVGFAIHLKEVIGTEHLTTFSAAEAVRMPNFSHRLNVFLRWGIMKNYYLPKTMLIYHVHLWILDTFDKHNLCDNTNVPRHQYFSCSPSKVAKRANYGTFCNTVVHHARYSWDCEARHHNGRSKNALKCHDVIYFSKSKTFSKNLLL